MTTKKTKVFTYGWLHTPNMRGGIAKLAKEYNTELKALREINHWDAMSPDSYVYWLIY